jgi:hypothetical protein
MNLKQVVAGAAIGCTLGVTGVSLGSGVANAAPPCIPSPQAQCGPGGPSGPPPQRGPEGPPPNDFRGPGGPGGPPPGDFRGPGGPPPGDFRGPDNHDWRPPWNPGDNDWRGRFHGAPWGNDLPPWAGAHHHRLRGMDRYLMRGGHPRRRSITGAFRSNRCGIPASTNGASGSSGSGFRSRSSPGVRAAASSSWRGRPRRSIHLSE